MIRRDFLKGTVATTVYYLLNNKGWSKNSIQDKTNVVLIMSDEHNPLYSSVYGHPFVQTPNMERMAQDGVVFENAYCPSPLCLPSRSSFMSGLYPHEHQCYSNSTLLLDEFPGYGEMLSKQGVYTTYIGKADVYKNIEEMKFNEVILGWNRKKPGDTFISRKPLCIREESDKREKMWGPIPNAHKEDINVIDTAVNWLKQKGGVLTQPFFLAVNISVPHFPLYAPPALWEIYNGKGDLPRYGKEQPTAHHPYSVDLRRFFQTDLYLTQNIIGLRQGYYACVTFTDQLIGKILDALEETKLKHHTVVIYTSDHGEMLGKFGLWWKCSLLEDASRIPLIVMGPGFEKNRRVYAPVTLLDVQATLFRTFSVERPSYWHGDPLQDIQYQEPNRFIFTEYHGHGIRGSSFMVRKGEWKLIWNSDAPHQLFNLAEDPNELNNLFHQESNAPIIYWELKDYLFSICDPRVETQRAETKISKQLELIKSSYNQNFVKN
ncbi:MAG: sulfatase-like hydrolase/transferase [Candidatus Hydrogenedentes bacterium]|nr:sulfatase-like hydrolase/transferase [Candidatus Hydrogenedentota bacterium]